MGKIILWTVFILLYFLTSGKKRAQKGTLADDETSEEQKPTTSPRRTLPRNIETTDVSLPTQHQLHRMEYIRSTTSHDAIDKGCITVSINDEVHPITKQNEADEGLTEAPTEVATQSAQPFDLRQAVIYSEILTPKFKEE
jgi:hypothetical protein